MVIEYLHILVGLYPFVALFIAMAFLIIEGGEAPFFFMLYVGHELQVPLLCSVVLSAMLMFTGDVLYFLWGPKLERWGWFVWFEKKSRRPIGLIAKYPHLTLPVLRFAYGLWHPTMVQLNSAGLSFRKLIEASILATGIWVLVLTGLFILVLPTGLRIMRHVELVMAGIILGVLLMSVIFRLILHRHFKTMDGNELGRSDSV